MPLPPNIERALLIAGCLCFCLCLCLCECQCTICLCPQISSGHFWELAETVEINQIILPEEKWEALTGDPGKLHSLPLFQEHTAAKRSLGDGPFTKVHWKLCLFGRLYLQNFICGKTWSKSLCTAFTHFFGDFTRKVNNCPRIIFIGPESDHWQCLSLTDSLTNWLTAV